MKLRPKHFAEKNMVKGVGGGGPSGHKRTASGNSLLKKPKDDRAGTSSKRSSKDKKCSKIVHTLNIADKNSTNNKSSSVSTGKSTPLKVVLSRASKLRAKPDTSFPCNIDLDQSEKRELEKLGYILSSNVGQDEGCLKYTAHFIFNTKSSPLRRKRNLWCKIVDKAQSKFAESKSREVAMLSKLRHPNVVSLFNVMERDSKVFIFTTGATHGSVLDFLAHYGPLFENHGRVWFRQILNGLQYLFDNKICHTNLNCESLLLKQHYNILITDFGYATTLTNGLCSSVNKSLYSAPEVLLGEPYNGKLADMWSLGVILYAFFVGRPPFRYYGNEDEQIGKLVVDQLQMIWHYRAGSMKVSPNAWKTVRSLLTPDVLERANLKTLKESSFYSMKECVCGYGSFKYTCLNVLGSLPDLYTSTQSMKTSKVEISFVKKDPKVCPALRDFFTPRKELSLKIEDAERNSRIIIISDEG